METYGELITNLPTDKSEVNKEDFVILNQLFSEENKSILTTILVELKDIVFIFILFLIFTIPQTTGLIQKYIPITIKHFLYVNILKGIVFSLLVWAYRNYYLSKA